MMQFIEKYFTSINLKFPVQTGSIAIKHALFT